MTCCLCVCVCVCVQIIYPKSKFMRLSLYPFSLIVRWLVKKCNQLSIYIWNNFFLFSSHVFLYSFCISPESVTWNAKYFEDWLLQLFQRCMCCSCRDAVLQWNHGQRGNMSCGKLSSRQHKSHYLTVVVFTWSSFIKVE